MRVRLAHETDAAGFRKEARRLLQAGVPPGAVHWSVESGNDDLFAATADEPAEALLVAAPALKVPAAFVELCETVALHREPQRFALLYRTLWRLAHEPALRHDPLDPDLVQLAQMAKAVRRDSHKMHAFVRFREVDDGAGPQDPLHVAWFEPEHHIVEANAAWFRRRFANMRWAILTPECCVEWDRRELRVRPGAQRSDAPPPDAGEELWLTYYQHIFNPARLKLRMMQKEMPRKYWRNLPEAQFIAPLAAAAATRSGGMLEAPATEPRRRLVRIAPALAPVPVAGSLEALAAGAQACRACPIGAHATQAVMGRGPTRPALMFVGEQPGDQEDLRGEPFVGPAGQLFDRALAQVGISRDTVFVSNAVRHFKFELRGKRRIHKTPSQQEAAACLHWLDQEIALVGPQALVALGATAARSLLGRPVAVTRERGTWLRRDDGVPVLVTLHPSALLRMPPDEQGAALDAFERDLRIAAAGPS